LAQDAQKEQNAWRDMQQSLANDRAKLQPDQIRARERELQDRVTDAQRKFRDRNNLINQAAQVGLAQIERTLVKVIQTVAGSHGMNIVLHRAQVALNVQEFDITDEVTAQLNKIQPTVLIPGENGAMPTGEAAAATAASASAAGSEPPQSAPQTPPQTPPQSAAPTPPVSPTPTAAPAKK
ncbi:MAG: OmpH family outer membrane protein, partial [Acetobacteraceae bacterium]|nr:OmpH family outer membrane protein [Acetobacteraceae bacterium]